MVRNFKGQVKISEVQKEFDELLSRINTVIDAYNSSKYVADIDYTKGDSTLGSSGYTLTLGGLKQVMKAMNGTVIGAKVFEVNNGTQVKITSGILITTNKIYRLPDTLLDLPSGTGIKTLYFNTDTQEYSFTRSLVKTTVYKEVPALDLTKDEDGNYIMEFNEQTSSTIACSCTPIAGYSETSLFTGIKDASNYLKTEEFDLPYVGIGNYQFITGDFEGNGFQLNKMPHISLKGGQEAFNLKCLAKTKDEYNKTKTANGMVLGHYFVRDNTQYFLPLIAVNSFDNLTYDNYSLAAIGIANASGIPMKVKNSTELYTEDTMKRPAWNNYGWYDDENYGGGIRLRPSNSLYYDLIDPAWNWDVHFNGLNANTVSDDANILSNSITFGTLRQEDIGLGKPSEIKSFELFGRWLNVQYQDVFKTSIQGKAPIPYLTTSNYGLDFNGTVIRIYAQRNGDGKVLPTVSGGVRQSSPIYTALHAGTRTNLEVLKETNILQACNMAIYATESFKSTNDVKNNNNNRVALRKDFYSPAFETGTTEVAYYDESTPDPAGYYITDIAPSRNSIYLNDIKDVQCENIYGSYEINSADLTFPASTWSYGGTRAAEENTDTSESAKFISGMEANQASNNYSDYYELQFGDVVVSSNAQAGKHENAYLQLVNFLYVPKGVNQPYRLKDSSKDKSIIRGFDVIENLKLSEDY